MWSNAFNLIYMCGVFDTINLFLMIRIFFCSMLYLFVVWTWPYTYNWRHQVLMYSILWFHLLIYLYYCISQWLTVFPVIIFYLDMFFTSEAKKRQETISDRSLLFIAEIYKTFISDRSLLLIAEIYTTFRDVYIATVKQKIW